jgi:hypothetical protein
MGCCQRRDFLDDRYAPRALSREELHCWRPPLRPKRRRRRRRRGRKRRRRRSSVESMVWLTPVESGGDMLRQYMSKQLVLWLLGTFDYPRFSFPLG